MSGSLALYCVLTYQRVKNAWRGSGPRVLHRALGQLDFQKLLDVDALLAACGSGREGSAALREAIESYDPRRKYTNGRLERLVSSRQLVRPRANQLDDLRRRAAG